MAGAILAVTLGTVVGHLGRARVDITRAAFRDVAVGLAHAKVSELEANPSRAVFAWTAPTTPSGNHLLFTWSWRLQDANAEETNTDVGGGAATPLSASLYSIEAVVDYPVRHASMDDLADGLADGRASVMVRRVVR